MTKLYDADGKLILDSQEGKTDGIPSIQQAKAEHENWLQRKLNELARQKKKSGEIIEGRLSDSEKRV
jgi:Mlc titration factor MtfA (ptsG expression regulator)